MIGQRRLSRRRMLRDLAAAGGVAAGAGALAGCTGSSGPGSSGNGYVPGSGTLKVQAGPEITDGPIYPDPWDAPRFQKVEKFADGSTTFRVVVTSYPGQKYETNSYAKYLEQLTGVKITYEVVPQGDEGKPKINAMMSSGDLPDAFLNGFNNFFTRSEVALYGSQGLFQPIDQLVDEQCPYSLELFKLRPKLRQYLTAPDKKMYGFCHVGECYHCATADVRMWLNQRWLDKVGVDEPTTSDELRSMLMAFRDQNPSGQADAIPMADCKDGGGMINYLLQSFCYTGGASWIDQQGDQLVFVPTSDAYREGMRWIRGLFADKLVDPNSFTQTGDQLIRKVMNAAGPLVGLAYGYSQAGMMTVDFKDPDNPYAYYRDLPPMTGPDGKAYGNWDYQPFATPGLMITKSCADPVTMARWADAQVAILTTMYGAWGPPNGATVADWAKKGEKGIDGRQAIFSLVEKRPPVGNGNDIWWGWGPMTELLDLRNAQSADPKTTAEGSLYTAGKRCEPLRVGEEHYFTEPYYDSDQASQLSELETNITNFLDQSVSQFCLGKTDIADDAAWNSYRSKLDQIGVQDYLRIQSDATKASS